MSEPSAPELAGGRAAQPLKWSSAFSVGHQDLDAEHQLMVELINKIVESIKEDTSGDRPARHLRELAEVAEQHFRREEAILQELKSDQRKRRPWLAAILTAAIREHAADHDRMLEWLWSIADRALSAEEPTAWIDCCEDLKIWFVDHVLQYESQVKTVFQSV
jgi:hemerythrin